MNKNRMYLFIAVLVALPGFVKAQNVGIGTQAPVYPLTLKDSLNSGNGIGFAQVSANGLVAIGTYVNNAGAYIQTHTDHDLNFTTNNGPSQMVLQTVTGNVGIGTLGPAQKLEVNGAVRIGNTAVNSKGTIRYKEADSSVEVYANSSWKSLINDFDIVGQDNNGAPPYFTSMIRSQAVSLPNLTYTVKKSGYYLVLLSADGSGVQEKNNIYNLTDNREDYEGEIKLRINGSTTCLTKRFFHISPDAADATQDTPWRYHSDDGEKSAIRYLAAGDIIQATVNVQQAVGANAPAQQNGWTIYAQVKYILIR